MTDSDSPWKELLEHQLALALAFFYPSVHADLDWSRDFVALDQELRKLAPQGAVGKRVADRLIQAFQRGSGDARFLHLEVQGQGEDEFARRVHTCNYRGEDRLGQHVVSLVILIDDDPDWRPGEYVASQYGCTRTLTFPVVKLLDYRGREAELEAGANPVGLFVVAQLESRRTRDDPPARAAVKLRLIENLHARKMDEEDLRQWYRYLDWLLALPEELEAQLWDEITRREKEGKMTFVTYGERVGIQKGMEKGMEKGRQEGAADTIEAVLAARFGDEGRALMPAIRKVGEIDRLLQLTQQLVAAATLDEARAAVAALPAPPGPA